MGACSPNRQRAFPSNQGSPWTAPKLGKAFTLYIAPEITRRFVLWRCRQTVGSAENFSLGRKFFFIGCFIFVFFFLPCTTWPFPRCVFPCSNSIVPTTSSKTL